MPVREVEELGFTLVGFRWETDSEVNCLADVASEIRPINVFEASDCIHDASGQIINALARIRLVERLDHRPDEFDEAIE